MKGERDCLYGNHMLLATTQHPLSHLPLSNLPAQMYDANQVIIADMVYSSGRSLASFKRDYFVIYQIRPAQDIREKRLTKS